MIGGSWVGLGRLVLVDQVAFYQPNTKPMPMENDSPDDMMDSGYGADAAPKESPEPKQSVDKENEEAGEETALVANKILSPDGETLKEGDEIVVKVVKNYGDECEIAYAPKKDHQTTESPSVESEIAAMDTKGNQ